MKTITIKKTGQINKDANARQFNLVGSSFQAEIEIMYSTLITILGQPNYENDGYKIDAEWTINTPYGVATIYNYKDGKNYLGDEGKDTEDIIEWRIGAIDKRASDLLVSILLDRR